MEEVRPLISILISKHWFPFLLYFWCTWFLNATGVKNKLWGESCAELDCGKKSNINRSARCCWRMSKSGRGLFLRPTDANLPDFRHVLVEKSEESSLKIPVFFSRGSMTCLNQANASEVLKVPSGNLDLALFSWSKVRFWLKCQHFFYQDSTRARSEESSGK